MAKNLITQNPYTVTGIKPGQWFLDSSEDYATLTAPGYLNSVANAGIDFQPNDFIFAQYNDGANVALFNVVESDPGVFSLVVYSPNSNSFVFTKVQYVAKGGSDLNPGTTLGLPKLTIGSAITALGLTAGQNGVVCVLDAGVYAENIVMPYNIQILAPAATISCTSGYAVTINDTGAETSSKLVINKILATSEGSSINLLGAQSFLVLQANVLYGDMSIEGTLERADIAQLSSEITIAATGVATINCSNVVSLATSITTGGKLYGSFLSLTDAKNTVYGDQTIVDRLIYQTAPSTETAGRTVSVFDGNKRIVYNSASPANYVLSRTSDVAIPIGTNIEFTQLGLGEAVFVAGTGVTIVSALGATVETNGTGSTAKAWKYSDTIWIISGDISAVA